jgi:hypothetical protein
MPRMITKNQFDIIDEKGKIIQSFRNRSCAIRIFKKLSAEMFGAKFEIKEKHEKEN